MVAIDAKLIFDLAAGSEPIAKGSEMRTLTRGSRAALEAGERRRFAGRLGRVRVAALAKLLLAAALLLAVLLAVVAPGAAQAATLTFDNGAATGSWHTATNWNPDQVPSAADDVVIPNPHTVAVTAAAAANSLRLGTGPLVPATLNLSGAAGVLDVDGGAASILDGTVNASTGGKLSLVGATAWNSGSSSSGDGTGVIANAGVLSIATAVGDSDFVDWENSGTIDYQGSDAVRIAGSGATIVNTGQVNTTAVSGTLNVGAVLSSSSGDWSAATNSTLEFVAGGTLAAGADVGGAGTVHFPSGTVTVPTGASYAVTGTTRFSGGTLALGVAGSTGRIQGDGGVRSGAGTLTVIGVAGQPSQIAASTSFNGGNTIVKDLPANSPDLVVAAVLAATGSGSTVTLEGQTAWNSGSFSSGDGLGLISNQGVLSIATAAGDSDFVDWDNSGTIDYQGSDALRIAGSGGTIVNTGQVTVSSGRLDTGAYTQTGGTTTVAGGATLGSSPALQGGVLNGTGTVVGDVNNSAGSVRPGASPGVLTITGNYTQGAGGTLQTEIAGTTPGTQFDRLAVSGSATLGGTLAIVNDPGFAPALSDTFQILSATSSTGTFAQLTGAQVGNRIYTPRYDPDGVTLLVDAAPNTPPDTTITSGPGTTTDHTPTFTFVSSEAGSTFQCSLDDGPFTACSSPFTTPSLADGTHKLAVRAIDNFGAIDPSPVTRSFQITTPATSPAPPACADGVDNDKDGQIDQKDPGCLSPTTDTFNPADNNEGDENLRQVNLCGQSKIKLVRADARGRRVLLSGFVATGFAGKSVELRVTGAGKARKLGSVRAKADGSFSARVKGPGKRAFNRARYQAVVAGNRSVKLKLPQSLASSSVRGSGNTLVLRGQVKRSVLGKRKPVIVKRLVCGKTQVVGKAKPKKSGAYVVRFPAPAQAAAALYRAEAKVLARPGGKRYVRQFARAIGVSVGG